MIAAMASKGLWRMIGQQVRSRRDRSIALGAGILVASVSFSLLTSAVATSRAQITGTLNQSFRPAYDILVRPQSSVTALEKQRHLVRDNYLANLYGGITLRQWHDIESIPGVEAAAPIANIGYVGAGGGATISLSAVIRPTGNQLYRFSPLWVSDDGLSSYADSAQYCLLHASAARLLVGCEPAVHRAG
jgi:hypothetical protein